MKISQQAFACVWFEPEGWRVLFQDGKTLPQCFPAIGYASNAALAAMDQGQSDFDCLTDTGEFYLFAPALETAIASEYALDPLPLPPHRFIPCPMALKIGEHITHPRRGLSDELAHMVKMSKINGLAMLQRTKRLFRCTITLIAAVPSHLHPRRCTFRQSPRIVVMDIETRGPFDTPWRALIAPLYHHTHNRPECFNDYHRGQIAAERDCELCQWINECAPAVRSDGEAVPSHSQASTALDRVRQDYIDSKQEPQETAVPSHQPGETDAN